MRVLMPVSNEPNNQSKIQSEVRSEPKMVRSRKNTVVYINYSNVVDCISIFQLITIKIQDVETCFQFQKQKKTKRRKIRFFNPKKDGSTKKTARHRLVQKFLR
uniref:Uncharacterized protein n=1 Tax=Cacopsylla melanoneura TaxID=428564 RepID=A0A8D8SPM1_9HEMI